VTEPNAVNKPRPIRKLAELKRQYHLAVSLHAPNDELRREIVPTAKKVALAEAGAIICDSPAEIGMTTKRALMETGLI
jgi:adenine C2-methylase RlmN of 23S rRNA A2503 and tRNA A37